jgi:hypothetical protein
VKTLRSPRYTPLSQKRSCARRFPRLEVLEDRTLFSVNVLVNSTVADTSSQDTQSETAVVLGSGSNVAVAFNDSESNSGGANRFTGFAQSSNGGTSFVDMGSLPASSAGDAGDPALASNTATGTIYLSTLGFSASNVVQVFRSTDNGATFGAPVNGAPGFGSSHILDKDWLTVDNSTAPGSGQGNVYLTFTDFGFFGFVDNGIYVTRSTDGGNTWSAPVHASPGNTEGSWVTTGPDHTVYVAYWDGSATPERLQLARSTNQGQTFTTVGTIATLTTTGSDGDLGITTATGQAVRSNAFPQVAVNPQNPSILYAVFNDKGTAAGDKADVFFTESTDGGSTWSAPVKVNDDATTTDQWQPGLAVTPDGTHVGVFWYDRRNDPANSLIDRYGAIGTVSGSTVTFGPNFRVSDSSFPAVVNQDPAIASSYMGDYDQVAADNSAFYTTWGDNRLADAAHAHQPDVRFARIPISSLQFQVTASNPTPMAGSAFSTTVTATDQNGNTLTSYTGTVHLASSDPTATFADAATGLPLAGNNYTFTALDQGVHTFTVTLTAAGGQTVSAIDSASGGTGSTSVTVSPAQAAQLAFGQQPTNTLVNQQITPAVTVRILDQFGNLTSSTASVTVVLGPNPGSGTLSGTTTVTASGGVASFGDLSINQAGTGYTLAASSSGLTGATSNPFNVTATSVIEGFETSSPSSYLSTFYTVVGATSPTAVLSTLAAHDGTYGLRDTNGNDWIFRNDATTQVKEGDAISVWIKLAGAADGRAYFGFGASASGTLSVVLAPNTGQFLVQNNSGYGFTNIGSAGAPAGGYLANHWYRLEVDWGSTGSITGQLFDSNGQTLLDTVTASTPSGGPTSGGIAFRAIGHNKYWDTVTDTPGGGGTSPRSAQGGPAGVPSVGDEASADSTGRLAATLDDPQGAPGTPAAETTPSRPAQGVTAPDLRTAQLAVVAAGPASALLAPAAVSGGAGVGTPPAALAPVLAPTFLTLASRAESGAAAEAAPAEGAPAEEQSARPESLPRPEESPAPSATTDQAAAVPAVGGFVPSEQAVTLVDAYWTALADEELPVQTEETGPGLEPVALAALAVILAGDRRRSRRQEWHRTSEPRQQAPGR